MKEKLPMSVYVLLIFALIAGNLFLYASIFAPTKLKITILETGKEGRIILVKSLAGNTVLINTGPDASILRALGTELSPLQRKIDAVLLTETSATTAGGLSSVLERYQVGALIRPETQGARGIETIISAAAAQKELQLATLRSHEGLNIGNGAVISVPSTQEIVISYGETALHITKNTPFGAYLSDGKTLERVPQ